MTGFSPRLSALPVTLDYLLGFFYNNGILKHRGFAMAEPDIAKRWMGLVVGMVCDGTAEELGYRSLFPSEAFVLDAARETASAVFDRELGPDNPLWQADGMSVDGKERDELRAWIISAAAREAVLLLRL